jgi:hypothetical protein
MSQVKKILEKANKARVARGLDPVKGAGFDYPAAIEKLKSFEYTPKEIGDCIGCSKQYIGRICKGAIPNHIMGELLCGLIKEEFGPIRDRDGNLTNALPLIEGQEIGGRVSLKKPGVKTIRGKAGAR